MSETAASAVVVRRAMSERMKKSLEMAVDKVERMAGQEKQAYREVDLCVCEWVGDYFHCGHAMLMSKTVADGNVRVREDEEVP